MYKKVNSENKNVMINVGKDKQTPLFRHMTVWGNENYLNIIHN